MFEQIHKLNHKRITRILITALIFFILFNGVVHFALPSYATTLRASEVLLDDNVCNFTQKDFQDITSSILKDDNPKIFFLGDSISYGIGVATESESISGYLREQNPNYSVHNLSSCGSKPFDYLLWIQYLSELDPNSENIYIVQYNYKWFNSSLTNLEDQVSQKRILYEFDRFLDEELLDGLSFEWNWVENTEHTLGIILPLTGNKTKLFISVLKVKSKEDFIQQTFFGKSERDDFAYKSQNWRQKQEFKNFRCKISYSDNEWSSENINFKIYEKTVDYLNANNLNGLVFLPAYNPELIKRCQTETFQNNVDTFLKTAEEQSVKSFEIIDALDESRFLDDMHLDPEGNEQTAQEISNRL